MIDENEISERGPSGELLYRIPANTQPDTCRRPTCRMAVFWVKTRAGKNMIVDTSVAGATYPPKRATNTDGVGAAHWGQCRDKDFVSEHDKTRRT